MTHLDARSPTPIPTRYAGYHFRSRLEARWAVFFDSLGIRWEYEPEGFQISDGMYLPDFVLWDRSLGNVYVEVKPSPSAEIDWRRAKLLATETDLKVLLLAGPPKDQRHTLYLAERDAASIGLVPYGERTPIRSFVWATFAPHRILCEDVRNHRTHESSPEFLQAIAAARSARFEHGHSGAS